ncbi:hypothetical protein APE_0374a [Aeropyrum pernix K1]|uniref:Uncharacterized protein n=1 Tax=Aeropyrum pernix (strain ATCC 700893 / DSM 11879 / JCM 9820 / NBRC 100138 / K1) TaxID=272557 RepID=Q05E75_AERPE|nr:hypothetical protein [Aeropyrum pernix]BAF34726.1 hypothetical protein APE_0374a [Aeropyrum pernix K1]
MTAGIKLYRVYYSTYSDDVHRSIVEELKKKFGAEVRDHGSRVVREFRFVEVLLGEPGREAEIEQVVKSRGDSVFGVKVEWVDTTR